MTYEELQNQLRQAAEADAHGDYDVAERLSQQTLASLSSPDFVQEGGTERAMLQAAATNMLGVVCLRRGDYPQALEHLLLSLYASQEIGDQVGTARALGNIGGAYHALSDYPKALEYWGKSLGLDEELGYKEGQSRSLGNIGIVHFYLSDYRKALEYWGKALNIGEELANKRGVAAMLGNNGDVHSRLADYPKALEYYEKALRLEEELGNKRKVAKVLGNIGVVPGLVFDYPKALEYYGKALGIDQELGNKLGVAGVLSNIGMVHMDLSEFAKAQVYFESALRKQEEIGNRDEAANTKSSLGALYALSTNPNRDESRAEMLLRESIAASQELGTKKYEAHKTLAELYERQERWQEANSELKKYHELEKKVQSEEAQQSVALMEQKKQIAEREKETAIAIAAADAKHQATEQLLHNVLPPSIAHKMLEGSKLIAEKLPQVSVLFADIVNFTKLSQSISPEELVEGLDRIFSSFDALAEKHGLEKIKTIGDAYIFVSGALEAREDHAEAMAKFAVEMQEAIKQFSSLTTGKQIELRIGIHSGEVVAGVIGKKKFQYDLWGDAVNTASRMESHGEAGKIHVSNDFFRLLQNRFTMTKTTEHGFLFEKRGEMEIKGKGMMRTYFLEKA